MKKILFTSILIIGFSWIGKAQIINFPDANFKGILLSASTSNTIATNASHFPIIIDTSGDGEIQLSEALQVHQLRITNANISNLSGIEYFANLANLNCNNNQLTSLALLATLPNLASLYCDQNQLTALDVSGLSALTQLSCNNNSITAANLNLNNNLIFLDCSNNPLGALNISTLTDLEVLHCNSNLLSGLDVTNLTTLHTLHCNSNSLSSLDVSTLINLKILDFSSNAINTIDLSALISLEYLTCPQNGLTALNVSSSPNLIELNCHINEITSLDLSLSSNLKKLQIHNNLFTAIDLTGLNVLEYLSCQYNFFTTLNLSPLNNLQHLVYGNETLGNIDVQNLVNLKSLFAFFISELPANIFDLQVLESLSISMSDINEVDASNLSSLNAFNSHTNENLSYVNLKNGNSFAINGISFSGNTNLMFVCVNDNDLSNVYDLNNNGVFHINSYCSFTPGGNYNTIKGTVLLNCDDEDRTIYTKVTIYDGIEEGTTFTNQNGEYTFFTQAGTYIIIPDIENESFFTLAPPIDAVIFADNNNNEETVNFCVSANGIHPDLEIVIAPIIPARPGFTAEYKIVYRNKGNQVMSQLYGINFFYNQNLMSFVSATQSPSSIVSGGMSWDFADLKPFESRSINVVMQINPPTDVNPVNIDDVLQFTTSIMPMVGDESTVDNLFQFNQTVVGSYDPNDIICIQGDVVDPSYIGEYLHYVINFENTGTAEAENVVVKTEVNPNDFDINSLRVLESSHNATIRIKNNILEIIFQTIMLDTGGHGNVLLKVKSKENLVINDVVSKNANIYFDYNYPILTNDANTIFQTLSNSIPTKDLEISMYPNPATSVVNIEAENTIKSVELYDVQGRIIQIRKTDSNEIMIDVSAYNSGIYFVKVTTNFGSQIEKIVKE